MQQSGIQWFKSLQSIKLIFVSASISVWIHDIFDDEYKFKFRNRELVKERPPPEILSTYLDTCDEKRCDKAVIDPGTSVWCRYARPLDLKERVFNGTNLSDAILCAVDFESSMLNNNAQLIGAKFYGANFFDAKLHGALLDEAKLHGAYLYGAELHGANLGRAELHGADLRGSDLRGAVLRKTKFYGADLANADLRGLVGLLQITCSVPSSRRIC